MRRYAVYADVAGQQLIELHTRQPNELSDRPARARAEAAARAIRRRTDRKTAVLTFSETAKVPDLCPAWGAWDQEQERSAAAVVEKKQLNFRASDLTRRQLERLTEWWGCNQSEAVTVAVDRAYQAELAKRDADGDAGRETPVNPDIARRAAWTPTRAELEAEEADDGQITEWDPGIGGMVTH